MDRPTDESREKSVFRPDIEGLRAVAVLYYAGVPFAWGGNVGFDVFCVISGFLAKPGQSGATRDCSRSWQNGPSGRASTAMGR